MLTNLSYFIVYIIEALIFYYYCTHLFKKRKPGIRILLIVGVAYLAEYLLSFFHLIAVNIGVFILFNIILLTYLYEIKFIHAVFHTIILTVAMVGTELIIAPMFTGDFWADQSELYNLFVQAPLCKLAYFIVVSLLIHVFRGLSTENKYTSTANFVLTGMSILTFVILYSLLSIYSKLPLTGTYRITIIANSVIILIINLISSWVYSFTLKKSEANLNLQLQLQKEQDYNNYYHALLKEDEQQRILIHDIRKHLQSIMALNEEHATQHISSYIKHLISDYELQSPVKISDNKLLNSICNRYNSICKEHGISFNTDIRKQCLVNLPENELTAIICNLLDNALESAIEIPDSYIEINIYKRKMYTYINVINSCPFNPIDEKSGRLISGKKTHPETGIIHGLGIKSVENIALRHQGTIDYHYDKDMREFHVIVSLCE